MQKSELDKFGRLLKNLHSRLRHMTNDELLGWHIVLEPYTYEECRDALVEYTRTNRYVPEPGEIARLIQRSRNDAPAALTQKKVTVKPPSETSPTLWRDHERHVAAFRFAGVPTAVEAKTSGLTYDEWLAMVEKAGL